MTPGYTQPEPAASQREVDALRVRIDLIDTQGTRGVGVIQLQITELVKDFAELRQWQAAHERQHAREIADRIAGRRWTITTVVAALAVVVTLLLNITIRLH